jgi:hypothetical protein
VRALILGAALVLTVGGCATLDETLGVGDGNPAADLPPAVETTIDAVETVGEVVVPGVGGLLIGSVLTALAAGYRIVRRRDAETPE